MGYDFTDAIFHRFPIDQAAVAGVVDNTEQPPVVFVGNSARATN
jgi:hypothetical protein